MSTQDTQPTLDAVEITGTEETPPSTMESFQLQEQLTSLQAGVDAVLTDPSLDIKLPQVEVIYIVFILLNVWHLPLQDEHNLRSTVQELERLNGQGVCFLRVVWIPCLTIAIQISIIEHLQSVVEQELNDLRSKVNQYVRWQLECTIHQLNYLSYGRKSNSKGLERGSRNTRISSRKWRLRNVKPKRWGAIWSSFVQCVDWHLALIRNLMARGMNFRRWWNQLQ